VDHGGRIALQQRGEQDSHGRWDVSVAGHQDVGEDDISAAARETAEELGIPVRSERLTRVGRPYEFRKIGDPSFTADRHENSTLYLYRTNKMNRERTSVFIIKVSEGEKKRVVTGQRNGAMAVRWNLPSEVASEIGTDRELFASSLKQLFDQADVLDRIQRELRRLLHTND
jgi:isopentenyldiphosphate isomerase